MSRKFYVGTAGWAIPKLARELFFDPNATEKPNHLGAYSAKLTAVEINSSFYREHQPKTYAKWAQATPANFRFAIKLAKRFTHVHKLKNVDSSDLRLVLEGIQELGKKLGVILIQLPPKLAFDQETAEEFFAMVRELHEGRIAVEPRHETWASREASSLFEEYHLARVVADPDRIGLAPAIKNAGFSYFRLHGSPRVYYSPYESKALQSWSKRVLEASGSGQDSWCIFDNTASGHATENALAMLRLLRPK